MKPAKSFAGFTLVELLVVVTLITITTTMAVPTIEKLVNQSRRHASVNEMVGLLRFARNAALIHQQTVTVCPLNTSNECEDNWGAVITAFIDPEANKKLEDKTQILRINAPLTGGAWKVKTANRPYFRFMPDGMARYAIGNLTWCPDNNELSGASHLIVSMGGRLRLAKDNDGDGVVDRIKQKPDFCL